LFQYGTGYLFSFGAFQGRISTRKIYFLVLIDKNMSAKIPVVIVDTYKHKNLARHAIERSLQTGLVDKVYSFSNVPIIPGEVFFEIKTIESTADYSRFVLHALPHFILEERFFLIQWDGFPLRGDLWDSQYMNFDYIGAPWDDMPEHMSVGNGGFSLRSRKLGETLSKRSIVESKGLPHEDAEDVIICRYMRPVLEMLGIKFAPRSLASTFSTEHLSNAPTLGFHGIPLLAKFCDERFLIPLVDEIFLRSSRQDFLASLVKNCVELMRFDLAREIILRMMKESVKYEKTLRLLNVLK
jgi:hypothetical protein